MNNNANRRAGWYPGEPDARKLAGLMVLLDTERRKVDSGAQLGTADMRMLWLLADGTGRSLREISDELVLEQSTVNRQVNSALRQGLLRKAREPGRVAAVFSPTEEGLALFEDEVERVLSHYAVGLDSLGDRAGDFLDLMDRFVTAYRESIPIGDDAEC